MQKYRKNDLIRVGLTQEMFFEFKTKHLFGVSLYFIHDPDVYVEPRQTSKIKFF